MAFRGTIKQLEGKLRIGNKLLNGADLSVFTRLGEERGFARVVGEGKKEAGARGRAPKIWEIDPTITLLIESAEETK